MSKFRQVSVGLFRQSRFINLSPCAKALYVVLFSQLEIEGIGQLIEGTIPPLVKCSTAEYESALRELRDAGWVDHQDDVFRIFGSEVSMKSANHRKYIIRRFIALPPENRVTRDWQAYLIAFGVLDDRLLVKIRTDPRLILSAGVAVRQSPEQANDNGYGKGSEGAWQEREKEDEGKKCLLGERKVMGEDSLEASAACDALDAAESIVFMGFGFDSRNVARLRLRETLLGKRVVTSAFGMTDQERAVAQQRVGGGAAPLNMQPSGMKLPAMLRETAILGHVR